MSVQRVILRALASKGVGLEDKASIVPVFVEGMDVVEHFWHVLDGLSESELPQTLLQVRAMLDLFEKRVTQVDPDRMITEEESSAAVIDVQPVHTRDTDAAWALRAWERRWDDPQFQCYLGKHVAIFEATIVADGETRDQARSNASLATGGTIPADRFVVDYWDDEE